jgi:hypothetical protein
MNADRINALLCAIHSIEGIEGGFSPHEKSNAVQELKRMLVEEEKKED